MSFWQGQSGLGTRTSRVGACGDTRARNASRLRRLTKPSVALLEARVLLTTPTIAFLAASANSLTYGQQEVFTVTVMTDPASSTVPSGGTVRFTEGSKTLNTQNLGVSGTATFSTTSLAAGTNVISATYSGDPQFAGYTTPLVPVTVMNTVAGGGNGDGGQATSTSLSSPFGVAVDINGDIFIADSSRNEIREVATTGVITTVVGTGVAGYSGDGQAATAADLNDPTGIAVDSSGDIFIADTGNDVVREVSGGVINTVAGDGNYGYSGDGMQATAAELSNPSAVAVDSHGNLFIADTGNNAIREVVGGVIGTVAGNNAAGPGYSGDGSAATSAQLNFPSGIVVDSSDDLFIADTNNNVVREVVAGTISTLAGNFADGPGYSGDSGPATSAQLDNPTAVAVDASGDLFIADAYNTVVREVSGGTITTIAGDYSLGAGDSGDGGPATAAQLNFPSALAVDATGAHLLIADSGSRRFARSLAE